MTPFALDDAGVRHLEYLFAPVGLPLVRKGLGALETTSAMVRGPAGSGKSSLAIALALACSRHHEGAVYYLSTEIAPTDVQWKAVQAGVGADAISGAQAPRDGAALFVDHLSAHEEIGTDDPGERARRALDVAWAWVEAHGEALRIRAVVIDAFSVVGARRDPAERTQLLEFLQGLEARGVSPILVEEAGATGTEWSAYLVDLLFDLSWAEDPDTGLRSRKLACPKSRYVTAHYGPFDYGRENGALAVWPPLSVLVEARGRGHDIGLRRSPDLLVSLGGTAVTVRGGLVEDPFDAGGRMAGVIARVPWLRATSVTGGASTAVRGGMESPLHEGPHSVGWSVIEALGRGWRSVRFHLLDQVAERRRFWLPVRDDLHALAALGVLVVVSARASSLPSAGLSFELLLGPEGMLKWQRPVVALPLLDLLSPSRPLAVAEELSQACDSLWKAEDRPALLRFTALHVACTLAPEPLEWLLKNVIPEERTGVAPYIAAGLVARDRQEEARPWMELALLALPNPEAVRPELEPLLLGP